MEQVSVTKKRREEALTFSCSKRLHRRIADSKDKNKLKSEIKEIIINGSKHIVLALYQNGEYQKRIPQSNCISGADIYDVTLKIRENPEK